MKRKIGISLVLTLLMVASAFSAVNAGEIYGICEEGGDECLPIDVVKKVWDGCEWVDYYEPELYEILTFNITVTYHKNCPNGYQATDIVVKDTLPVQLEYIGSTPFAESWINENKIYWNLTEDYGINLSDGESVSLEFTAKVIDYGEFDNCVKVTAWETCCGWGLQGTDCVTIYLESPPPLEFEKLVYDPETGEWVDYLDGVLIGQLVKFKIVITYVGLEGVDVMKCMIVQDWLPQCCLIYADNEVITYPNPDNFADPDVTVSPDGKYVVWDWTNVKFNLFAGETITIEFEAEVVEYCYDEVENCASVDLWGCLNCQEHLYGEDCATVNCVPPDTTFDKTVWDVELEEWIDDNGYGVVGQLMYFKLEFVYYGNEDITDARFKDVLPCVLEIPEEGEYELSHNFSISISEDRKTIWFNLSEDVIEDSDVVTIIFGAIVTGVTGDCCPDPAKNKAWLYICEGPTYYDELTLTTRENVPPCPPIILDDNMGAVGEVLDFTVETGDYNGDDIYYYIDWGDESENGWIGPYASGDTIPISHEWAAEGEYTVKAKAKDIWGAESNYGSGITVIIEGQAVPDISICIKRGIGLKISLKNNKEVNISDVEYNVTVSKRLLGKQLLHKNGTIEVIEAGQTETLQFKPRGFGLINIQVEVIAPGIDPIVKNVKGVIFFSFIWIRY